MKIFVLIIKKVSKLLRKRKINLLYLTFVHNSDNSVTRKPITAKPRTNNPTIYNSEDIDLKTHDLDTGITKHEIDTSINTASEATVKATKKLMTQEII